MHVFAFCRPATERSETYADTSLIPSRSGSWSTWTGLTNQAYNATVPSINGPVSNSVEGYPTHSYLSRDTISQTVTESWYNDRPIAGAIQGCAQAHCKVNITAPALFPTCKASSIAVDATQPWNWQDGRAMGIAPPVSLRIHCLAASQSQFESRAPPLDTTLHHPHRISRVWCTRSLTYPCDF